MWFIIASSIILNSLYIKKTLKKNRNSIKYEKIDSSLII